MPGVELLDVTVRLGPGIPLWPGSPGLRLERVKRLADGDGVEASVLECDVHAGTHVDAPLHFIPGGRTVDDLPLDALVGPALVVDLGDAAAVEAPHLAGQVPAGTERVLLRTRNSRLWSRGLPFSEGFAALTADAARLLVDRGVRLVGIDYLSVQRFGDGPDVHLILLGAGVVVVEGLDLSAAEPGPWELLCLPLRLAGAEAAPARVLLRRERP